MNIYIILVHMNVIKLMSLIEENEKAHDLTRKTTQNILIGPRAICAVTSDNNPKAEING